MRPSEWSSALASQLIGIPISVLILLNITVLLTVAWIVHRALAQANPRWRVFLWRGVAIAVVLLPLWMQFGPPVAVPIVEQRHVVESPSQVARPAVRPASSPGPLLTVDRDEVPRTTRQSRPRDRASEHASAAPGLQPTIVAPSTEPTPPVSSASWGIVWRVLVGVVWLTGFVLIALRTLVGHWRVGRLLSTASPAPDWITQSCLRVNRELPCRRIVEVVVSTQAQVPFLCGLWRERIVMPARFCDRRFVDDLPAIFAHELAHARSRDVWWNTALRILAAALWFHPLAWRMPHAHASACENVGDAVSATFVGDARHYSRVLARVALELLSRPASTAVAMARTAEISRRLDALGRTVPDRSLSRWLIVSCGVLGLTVVLSAASLRLVHAEARPATTPKGPVESPPTEATTSSQAALQPGGIDHAFVLRRIQAAWKARQERFKTFHYAWETRMTAYGQIARWTKLARLDLSDRDATIPRLMPRNDRKTAEFTLPHAEFWGDADRYRDDFDIYHSDNLKDWGRLMQVRHVIDGLTHTRLVTPEAKETPMLTIWREVGLAKPAPGAPRTIEGWHFTQREIELLPLMLAFRALHPGGEIDSARWRVVNENAIIGTRHCIKLQADAIYDEPWQKRLMKKSSWDVNCDTCWVDPSRDYVVVLWERIHEIDPGGPALTISIDYRQDKHGWIPSGWQQIVSSPGRNQPKAVFEAKVTAGAVNESIPSGTFTIATPPGTRICDVTVDEDTAVKLAAESAAPAGATSMDAIVAAWQRRQARIGSYRVSWQCEWTVPWTPYDDPSGKFVPPKPLPQFETFKWQCTQWVDGERFAFHAVRQKGAMLTGMVLSRRAVFDGHTSRTFYTVEDQQEGAAKVRPGFDQKMAERGDARPALLALRPVAPNVGRIDPAKCRVLSTRGMIDGVPCTIIGTFGKYDQSPCQFYYWLDPARDYLVLRESHTANGCDCLRLDISYRSEPNVGWVPSGWKQTQVAAGGAFWGLSESTVAEAAINTQVAASTFQFAIPPGSHKFTDGP